MSRTDLARWVVDFVDANRRKANGCRDFMAEDFGSRVSNVGVRQHTRNNLVTIEGHSVCIVSPGDPSIACRIVPASFAELLLRPFLELVWVGVERWKLSR